MVRNGLDAYKKTTVTTTESKERILLMVLEGAVSFVHRAQTGIQNEDPCMRGENISRAIAILDELCCSLDMEVEGEIATNLDALYHYMIKRLTHANLKNDVRALNEVLSLLIEIKEAFEGAAQELGYRKPGQTDVKKNSLYEGPRLAAEHA